MSCSIMNATVIQANPNRLLVRDMCTGNEVIVSYQRAGSFSSGDNIRITFDGRMTHSIPPQISARYIHLTRPTVPPGVTPRETRAVILQRGRGFLIVRSLRDHMRLRVVFREAHHFCVGQRIIIRHDSIVINNIPELRAIDIEPEC